MTSELHFDPERAAEAQRAAFALMTIVLTTAADTGVINSGDIRRTLRMVVDPEAAELVVIGKLADIVEVMTWYAAGNLIAASGSVEGALSTIRAAALYVEHMLRDERGETGD